ncbi:hypothetical protein T10_82 [Trichinella papuae]|uniref:Uncharacterized protein n=1 Tax=Trichinella papuae TaxID=268474 RepID=A0A0V1N2Q5_9BILA|nr:hypothetical protein T10_82 [Trichinella papuae]
MNKNEDENSTMENGPIINSQKIYKQIEARSSCAKIDICAVVLAAGLVRSLGFSLFDCLLSMLVVRWYSGLRSKVERHEIYLDELLLGNCRLRKTKLQTELTDRSHTKRAYEFIFGV